MISAKSLNKIAAALAPEVVEYIYNDERWIEFLIQMISDAVVDKMGQLDYDLYGNLCYAISENIGLSGGDTCRTVY
jgi:hypothetical protein